MLHAFVEMPFHCFRYLKRFCNVFMPPPPPPHPRAIVVVTFQWSGLNAASVYHRSESHKQQRQCHRAKWLTHNILFTMAQVNGAWRGARGWNFAEVEKRILKWLLLKYLPDSTSINPSRHKRSKIKKNKMKLNTEHTVNTKMNWCRLRH